MAIIKHNLLAPPASIGKVSERLARLAIDSYPVATDLSFITQNHLIRSSSGLSMETLNTEVERSKLKNAPTPSRITIANNASIEEKVFDASAQAKIAISLVSMHLDADFKDKLFLQIDRLLDLDEWDPDDNLMQQNSFTWFLKAILDIKPERVPSLGLSHSGNVLCAWVNGKNRLVLEFLTNGIAKWVVSINNQDITEQSSASVNILKLKSILQRYDTDIWFKK